MSIRARLSIILLMGTVVLLGLVAVAAVWIERLTANSLELAERAQPMLGASREMEINVLKAAQAVTAYSMVGGATIARRFQIEESLEDFTVLVQMYRSHADTDTQRQLADQLATRFQEFIADANFIIQNSDEITQGMAELRQHDKALHEILNEDLEATVNVNSFARSPKSLAALRLKVDSVKSFETIKDYLAQPTVETRTKFNRDLAAFRDDLSVFRQMRPAAAEAAWAARLDAAMTDAMKVAFDVMQMTDTMLQLRTVMSADLRLIEDLLEDGLQPAVAYWVSELRSDSQRLRINANMALLVAGFVAVAFAIGAAVHTRRNIVIPLGRLAETAAEIGRGRFSVKIPNHGSGEIGVLAQAMRRMLDDLRATTVSRSHLYAILGSLSESVLVVSTDGKIQSANQATCDLTGFTETELVGLHLHDFVKGTDQDISELSKRETPGMSQGSEAHYAAKGGREIPMLLSFSPLRNDAGEIDSFVVSGVDYTLQYEARSQLARSNAELERFAFIASHDLQEPLRMVSSFTQLLQQKYRDQLDSDAQDYINFAADGAQRMRELISDLLAYSRVGRTGRSLVSVDCTEVVQQACANLATTIDDTGATITWQDLPKVRGDRRQLERIFQNLFSNAIKYRRAEKPQIIVSARSDGIHSVIAVADNGIGIEPQYLERIFEPFQRLHSREQYEGTGIGLAICRRIIDIHIGRIWAESQPGVGTTIRFNLLTDTGEQDGNTAS